MKMDEKFKRHLLDTFRVEADEHLQAITSNLIALEQGNDAENTNEYIELAFREAHSLKGASRAVNQKNIEIICQAVESVFSSLKVGRLVLETTDFDVMHQCLDYLNVLLEEMSLETEGVRSEKALSYVSKLEAILDASSEAEVIDEEESDEVIETSYKEESRQEEEQIDEDIKTDEPFGEIKASDVDAGEDDAEKKGDQAPVQEMVLKSSSTAENVRVSVSRLSNVLLQAEEMLSAKLASVQRTTDLKFVNASFREWKKEWNNLAPMFQELKVTESETSKRLDPYHITPHLMLKLVRFLEWNSSYFKDLENQYGQLAKRSERDSLTLGNMVDNLLDDMKKVTMFPFSSVLELFPKMVRDMARDSGRKINFEIKGGEIEIDRRILEEIKDPLIHLIRNSIDHGIEKPDLRKEMKKPETGQISIEVFPKNQMVELIISDDGAGIDTAKIREEILKNRTVSKSDIERISEQELITYMYQSGVSTSPLITEFSGRGLGLAIVREKVEKLGGTISVTSKRHEGTQFKMVLPLTVATFRGILVRSLDQVFVLPTMYVERVVRMKWDQIQTVENRATIPLNNEAVSLVRLSDTLELKKPSSDENETTFMQAVVLSDGGIRIAFQVDEVIKEQEVLFKSLGKQLIRVRNIAGATVLGTGKAVPIVNVSDLLKSAIRPGVAKSFDSLSKGDDVNAIRKSTILVVEDSITTRTLLKNILETANYNVLTAVDGAQGYSMACDHGLDAVVSDVEMPHMNGFELTTRIRKNKELEDLPVVLVTALEKNADKERGIEVGADAYIVKNTFDQSRLLEVLDRLIVQEEFE